MIAQTADEIAPWTEVPDAVWHALRGILRPYVGASFTIHDKPKRKERPRGLKGGGTYTPPATKAAEKVIAQHFTNVMPGWEPEPDRTYGLLVELITTEGSKVDLDNCLKLVMDALNNKLWLDDIQVGATFVYISRGRGVPRTEVEMFAWQNNGTPATKVCACGTRYRSQRPACHACSTEKTTGKQLTAGKQLFALAADEPDDAELAGIKRRVFRYIGICMMGSDTAPTVKAIAEEFSITVQHAQAAVDALIADGNLARTGRKLRIVKPMGAVA